MFCHALVLGQLIQELIESEPKAYQIIKRKDEQTQM